MRRSSIDISLSRRRSSSALKRLDILALIRRALKPSDEIEALNENEVQDFLILAVFTGFGFQGFVQLLR